MWLEQLARDILAERVELIPEDASPRRPTLLSEEDFRWLKEVSICPLLEQMERGIRGLDDDEQGFYAIHENCTLRLFFMELEEPMEIDLFEDMDPSNVSMNFEGEDFNAGATRFFASSNSIDAV